MNLLPLVEDLKIITKDLGVQRLGDVMNYAQREVVLSVEKALNEGKPVRIIILKARQIGVSTIVEAIVFILSMYVMNLKCMIISHELDSAEHLLSMTQNYWNSYRFKRLHTPRNESQKRLGWKEMNTAIRITTAKNVDTGRSQTIHVLHASEVAFWPDPDTLMVGLRECIPSSGFSIIVLESTANGLGDYFANTWEDASKGENEYVPLFFPWHKHPEYSAEFAHLDESAYPPPSDPDEIAEEKLLRGMGIGDDRLLWRRYKIKESFKGNVIKFKQEYPATPDEAFQSTGTNIFPLSSLNQCYEPKFGRKGQIVRENSGRVRFQPNINGPLKLFKLPSDVGDYGIYMLGGDPTRTTTGDPACVQVLNRRTWEQVAVWRGHIDPTSFANVLQDLGNYYNTGMIIPEVTGPGYATIGALLQLGYPYIWKHQYADKAPGREADTYGWQMTVKRKHWAMGNLLKAVLDGDITIHDDETFHELRNYVVLPGGDYGPNSNDGHDDTVTSLAIAVTGIITEHATVTAFGTDEGPGILEQLNDRMRPIWEDWDEEAVN